MVVPMSVAHGCFRAEASFTSTSASLDFFPLVLGLFRKGMAVSVVHSFIILVILFFSRAACPYLIRGLLLFLFTAICPAGSDFYHPNNMKMMLGIGTPLLLRGCGPGQLAWAEDLSSRRPNHVLLCGTNTRACPLWFPSMGPSKKKNNDAICLNLKTCILQALHGPSSWGAGGRFHSLMNGFPSAIQVMAQRWAFPLKGGSHLASSLVKVCRRKEPWFSVLWENGGIWVRYPGEQENSTS